jgi:hypothetical protein
MKYGRLPEMWHNLPRSTREKICKQYGFADYTTYASHNWEDFRPHTRDALAERVALETDAAYGFDIPE